MGDFRRLVEAVQRKGLRVTVISTIKSQPPMIADELRRQADNFIELTDLQEFIARPMSNRPNDNTEASAKQARLKYERACCRCQLWRTALFLNA